MTDSITITAADDWHVHFRDGAALTTTVPYHAQRFARALAMPNLVPPVTTVAQALAYRQRIIEAANGASFRPYMALYMTESLSDTELQLLHDSPDILGIKYYPAGATTNSESGVRHIHTVMPALQRMAELQIPLLLHAEVTDSHIDIFDREAVFLESILKPLLHEIPDLRVVVEHVTTAEMAQFVESAGDNVAATITPQHLMYNRNSILAGGIRPHFYCLPVLKREKHREYLTKVVTSGNPRFFLGTDSAPHSKDKKESSCGCAGIFSAPIAIEIYADIFESLGILHKLEAFASHFGADFYGLPRNSNTITLQKRPHIVATELPYQDQTIIPLCAGEDIHWQITSSSPSGTY